LSKGARIPGLPSYFLLFVSAMVAIGPFAIDTYLPAMPTMANALGVEIVSVNATLSTYLFGFAFGQLFGGRHAVGCGSLDLDAHEHARKRIEHLAHRQDTEVRRLEAGRRRRDTRCDAAKEVGPEIRLEPRRRTTRLDVGLVRKHSRLEKLSRV